MKASFVTLLLTTMLSLGAFAHGMNKAGPHGGYVRMPGNYHVELVSKGRSVEVYFLDMMFKPITIDKASTTLSLNGIKGYKTVCKKEAARFVCDLGSESLTSYQEAVLETSKDGKAMAQSSYKLPLSL